MSYLKQIQPRNPENDFVRFTRPRCHSPGVNVLNSEYGTGYVVDRLSPLSNIREYDYRC